MSNRALLVAIALGAIACTPEPAPPPRTPLLASMAAQAVALDASTPAAPNEPAPPVAKREPHPTTLHGHTLTDDYYWLRNKGTPEVVSYLEAENAYTEARTKPIHPFENALYAEMLSRTQEDDSSAPVRIGDWLYYERTAKGKQYPIECRAHVSAAPKAAAGPTDAPEQVILDLNEIATHEQFVSLGAHALSDDGNLLAYALDTTGFKQFTLHVRDLRTGADLPERVERVDAVAFARDPHVLFYVTEDATTKRPNLVHTHTLGSDPAKDPVVYEDKDERFEVDLERSRSKDFIVVTSGSHTTTEVRLFSARDPKAPAKLVEPRQAEHEYYVEPGRDRLFIRTNSGGRNFRLVTATLADPSRAHWKELVPHRSDVMIEEVEAFADRVVLFERSNARLTLRSIDVKSGASTPIPIDEPVYELDDLWNGSLAEWNPEFASPTFRFAYATPTTPLTVYDMDVRTGARTLVKRKPVPNFDSSKYVAERVDVTARDGTRVPVSLVHLRDQKPDGTHAMFLRGYGSYGIPYDFGFESNLVSLLDRGVVCALAHIRGGGDLGKPWHDAGRMMNKKTTFTDFIDAGEGLVKAGWAKPGAIGIQGGSAGGLLMGAVTEMRPDLWRAVIANVPFVDVINSMLDESLPLTVGEFEEWGNPKIEAQYDAMVAYSPYDNVAHVAYPAMLVETSYNDSQVMYWEPAKWVARLRATKAGDSELLLKTNMKPAGHHGLSGRYDHMHERAFDYAWLLSKLGIDR